MVDMYKQRVGQSDLVITKGDITLQKTDAIVNAANSGLRGGGGVDGAIHRAAGSVIDRQCKAYIVKNSTLPTGKAMWTEGGNLSARYVIHTVGPIYRNDAESEPLLKSAYKESLKVAEELGIESISFPAISAGVYGYPLTKAANVALSTICCYLKEKKTSLKLVQMICFTEASFTAFKKVSLDLPF